MNRSIRATTIAVFLRHAAAGLALAPAAASVAAHDYYTPHFQIVHPWTDPAAAGTQRLGLFMRFAQVEADDLLLSASSPVAEAIELRAPPTAETGPVRAKAVALPRGVDVELEPKGTHFVMRNIRKDLPFGSQHPLVLVFEKAGRVEIEFVVGSD